MGDREGDDNDNDAADDSDDGDEDEDEYGAFHRQSVAGTISTTDPRRHFPTSFLSLSLPLLPSHSLSLSLSVSIDRINVAELITSRKSFAAFEGEYGEKFDVPSNSVV